MVYIKRKTNTKKVKIKYILYWAVLLGIVQAWNTVNAITAYALFILLNFTAPTLKIRQCK